MRGSNKIVYFLQILLILGCVSTSYGVSTESCFSEIKNNICYVDEDLLTPAEFQSEVPYNIKHLQHRCIQTASVEFVDQLEVVFNQLPNIYQKTMCSLKKIVIFETATPRWAGEISGHFDEDSVLIKESQEYFGAYDLSATRTGHIMKLYTGTFKESFQTAVNRHLSYSFAGSVGIKHHWKIEGPESRLYYVLVHELSHVLDSHNKICPCDPRFDADCSKGRFQKGSGEGTFANFSWTLSFDKQSLVHKDRDDNSLLGQGLIVYRDTRGLYSALTKSTFASIYGSSNCNEDFAELMTAEVMKSTFNASKILSNYYDDTFQDFFSERESTKEKVDFINKNIFLNKNLNFTPETKNIIRNGISRM